MGRDYGAYYYGVRESHLNLRVAQKLESYLKDRGYSTAMTRRSDAFVSLSRRAAIANRYRNAIFVSIHFNATRDKYVRGAETFYAGSSRGRALASAIQSQLVSKLNVRNRGVRYGRLYRPPRHEVSGGAGRMRIHQQRERAEALQFLLLPVHRGPRHRRRDRQIPLVGQEASRVEAISSAASRKEG